MTDPDTDLYLFLTALTLCGLTLSWRTLRYGALLVVAALIGWRAEREWDHTLESEE